MQVIEVSIVGVRSAIVTLKRRDTPMQFVLLPMIHLGTPHFYRAILTRLGSCQLIVAEGVRGKTAAGSLLTPSYRMLGRSRKLGLVAQNLDLDALGVPVIRPDMTGEEFEKRWHQAVPVLHRLLLWLVAPLFAIGMLLFGTRRMLGRTQCWRRHCSRFTASTRPSRSASASCTGLATCRPLPSCSWPSAVIGHDPPNG